ncbi:hypothetical protein BB560_003430 [Smittium megazygosporum]|uniref:rRNA-processing protein EFG1 n=1 Tax=Smittium megazygosporum TaxID=133381 RepID=A0A2T9ZC22_9FUNG|nr:hypothetical protein BB560_003430 [Smittium megazygosporum]
MGKDSTPLDTLKTKTRIGKNKKQANKVPRTLPQVKKRLRDIERLRAKITLSAQKNEEFEREVKGLLVLQKKFELVNKEKKNAKQYHAIKFFDKSRIMGYLRIIENFLSSEPESQEALQLQKELLVDLNYLTYFPNQFKYISLYPKELREKTYKVSFLEKQLQERNIEHKNLFEIREKIRLAIEQLNIPIDPRPLSTEDKQKLKQKIHSSTGFSDNITKDESPVINNYVDNIASTSNDRVDPNNNPNSIENDEFFEI